MIKKPKFWDEKKISFFAIILLPISLIFSFIIFLKKIIINTKKFNVPIICVGNIYVGGTGKTPLSILLAKELSNNGIKTAIIRKFYKSHQDEYGQIKNNFKQLIISKNRIEGINKAIKNNFDSVILDDGFQDYKIKKNLSIICFHQNQLIGNGFVLPSGPLRENLNSLKNANIILINGKKDKDFENKLLKINNNLEIYYFCYEPVNIKEFKNHELLALAGIANPENFFKIIEKNKLKIKEKLIYPDHYELSKNEILKIIKEAKRKNLKIIMTEKDFFKVNKFKFNDLNFLKINLKIFEKDKLIQIIKKLHD